MAKKSGFARAAEALAIGIGAGMEGYGKGTMASLVEQRRAALEEIRDRRAAQQALEEREWRTQESEKTREFQRETAAESMAWEKEKFGMEQAADEARTNRTLAAQERLAKLRGGGGGVGRDSRTASEKDADTYARLIDAVEKGEPGAEAKLRFFEKTKRLEDRPDSSRDDRTASEKDAATYARLEAAAESGDASAVREFEAFKRVKGLKDEESSGPSTRDIATMMDALDPYGVKAMKDPEALRQQAIDALNSQKTAGSTEAVPGPTPPPGSVAPSQAEQAPPKEIGGDGTREKPLEATSLEELEALYESSTTGTWVRYKNKLYQKK